MCHMAWIVTMPLRTGLGLRYYRLNIDVFHMASMRRNGGGFGELIRDPG